MKKQLIAAIVGTVALGSAVMSSQAQGYVVFSNYASTPYYPVVYGSIAQGVEAGLAGTGALGNVSVELGYFIGTFTANSVFTMVPASITAINPALMAPPNGVGQSTTGYFTGPGITIASYSSGPISFMISAFTTSGTSYTGTLKWTEPSISTAVAAPFTALPGEVVLTAVPEPSTLALAGLGGFGMLMALRRKKA